MLSQQGGRTVMYWLGLALSTTITLLTVSIYPAEAQTTVRMGQGGESLIYFPLYVARDRGFFTDEGIDLKVVVVASGAEIVAAQMGGNIDFQETTLLHVIRQNEQGLEVAAFASVYQELGLDLVVSAAKVKELGLTESTPIETRVRALKGLKIGLTRPGTSTDLFMRKLLTDYGLKPDGDVTLTPVGDGPSLVAALEHGVIDAFVYPPPFPQAVEVRGLGKVILSTSKGEVENLRGFQYQVLAAPRKFVQRSPDTILRLTRALAKGERFTKEHPEEAKSSVAKFFPNIDQSTLKLALDSALFGVPGNPILRKRGYELNETMLNLGVSGGGKYSIPAFDKIVINKFAEQASAK